METDQLKKWIAESSGIVFFGGAGISTESGIPDFRSKDGIYKTQNKFGYPPETMLSHTFFIRHPEVFFQYYTSMLVHPDARPNAAHLALARLEKHGKLKAVVTQNIDGLHQMAGSKKVLELHGSIHRNYCVRCRRRYGLDFVLNAQGVPYCEGCGGIVRPDVTLYEEQLDYGVMQSAVEAIRRAEVLIVGGTSLSVYPAAGLVRYYEGHRLVLINKSPTPYDSSADLLIAGSLGEVLGACCGEE